MSDHTEISWSDATWNPVTGCTKVSPGCDHCYIDRAPPFRMAHRRFDKPGIGGTTGVLLHPDRLEQPLHWRKPRRIFVNSLSDLFHADVPDDFLVRVFDTMGNAPQHVFQVLTKRPPRMRSFVTRYLAGGFGDPGLPSIGQLGRNIWLGVSTEDQKTADLRIPILLDIPAAVRWISAEPLLGPLDLFPVDHSKHEREWDGGPGYRCLDCSTEEQDVEWTTWSGPAFLDWVVAGGESGPGARPAHPDWFRSLRDQCATAGVPLHIKQWGEWSPADGTGIRRGDISMTPDGRYETAGPGYVCFANESDGTLLRPGREADRRPRAGRRVARRVPGGDPVTHRGTVHANDRGSAADRRRRREWLMEEYGVVGIVLCWRCDLPLLIDELTVDRYPVPGCDGGTYRRSNIRPACARCNSEAGGRTRRTIVRPSPSSPAGQAGGTAESLAGRPAPRRGTPPRPARPVGGQGPHRPDNQEPPHERPEASSVTGIDFDEAVRDAFEAATADDVLTKAMVVAGRTVADAVREQFAGQDLRLVGEAMMLSASCGSSIASCQTSQLVVAIQGFAGALVIDGADREAGR